MLQETIKDLLVQHRPFSVKEAASYFGKSTKDTAIILARFAKQGHLKRIKRGLYYPISDRFLSPTEFVSDAWVFVPALFPNSYIGGWSAANFWTLTDQIFQATCILISSTSPKKNRTKAKNTYILFKTKQSQDYGIETTWRETIPISISDPHRTVLDMIDNPRCGAGIQHTIDCFKVYSQEHYQEDILLDYAQKNNNGAFFKRLGFIGEKIFDSSHPLCHLAQQKLTKGYSLLDLDMPCHKLITKWNLFINSEIDI